MLVILFVLLVTTAAQIQGIRNHQDIVRPESARLNDLKFPFSSLLRSICIGRRCDGITECANNLDERYCDNVNYKCGTHQFRCNNGKCISRKDQCNGVIDCPDTEDESCNFPGFCGKGFFQCGDGTCIQTELICDTAFDCQDKSDETSCPAAFCGGHQFNCRNKKCIPLSSICNGADDCGDDSDEVQCSTDGGCHGSRPFRCTTDLCIPTLWVCDGTNDCGDNSDERGCFTTTTISAPKPATTSAPTDQWIPVIPHSTTHTLKPVWTVVNQTQWVVVGKK